MSATTPLINRTFRSWLATGFSALVLAASVSAASYFASFGGNLDSIGKYPLSPNAWGIEFSSTSADARALTFSGDKLYWIENTNIWMQNSDGSNKTLLTTFGIAPIDLAVDPLGFYYASFGGSADNIGKYPLVPNAWGIEFSSTSADAHSLTFAGDKLYWLENTDIWMQNSDGSNKALLHSFGAAPTSFAVDVSSGFYYASFGGNLDSIGKYPLIPDAWGTEFSSTSGNPHELTFVDDKLYWLEGTQVWVQNADGSNKTEFQDFGIAPLSLAVEPLPSRGTPVPEPSSFALIGVAVLGAAILARRFRARKSA